jgi:hypothetical protein
MDRQCSSCGGFCKKSGCERENVKSEPEPVAWMHIHGSHEDPCFCELTEDEISQGWTQKPLYYTAPPQREWVGLTHKEHMEIMTGTMTTSSRMAAVEAKLKEKNT